MRAKRRFRTSGWIPMQKREFISKKEAQGPFFVGLDLGGTNIKVGVVDDCGRPMFYNTIPTYVGRGPDDASKRMGAAISNAITGAGLQAGDVAGVGLGSPGTMDIPAGKLVVPANLKGWEHFPLRDRVAHYAGMPVTFANDATAAAFGELWVGSGKAFHSMVLLTLGTGIGCGIIIGDLLLDGEHSHGGEFGHHIIDSADNARVCGCGRRGHFEAYASATAVAKRTRELLDAGARVLSPIGWIEERNWRPSWWPKKRSTEMNSARRLFSARPNTWPSALST